jgi:hypothetical protein
MSTLINSFLIPSTPVNYTFQNSSTYSLAINSTMFVTNEGLLAIHTKTNSAAAVINKVILINPGVNDITNQPTTVSEWSTPTSPTNSTVAQWSSGYSATHGAMIGLVNGGATSLSYPLYKLDLRTGAIAQIGRIDNTATGVNDSNCDQCVGLAFDGTYLHYLKGSAATIYMIDIVSGAVVRSYMAPFGMGTNSIHYGGNGFMYFGGGYHTTTAQVNHVAKVQYPTTGSALQDATVVGVWKIPDFNSVGGLQNRMTNIGWDGKTMLLYRRGTTTIYRYDLTNDPFIAIISPLPARIATSSSATVTVRVLDDTGGIVVGARVELTIDNGGGATYGSTAVLNLGSDTTNINGEAFFTYTAGVAQGIDNLKATVRY